MKNIIYIILVLSLFSACSNISDEDLKKARVAVSNGAIIVDVRTPKEFKKGHIKDSINIPLKRIEKNLIAISKNTEIVVYCRSGSRSQVSAKILRENGWTVHDIATRDDWNRKIKK